jgi:hypothetical protein
MKILISKAIAETRKSVLSLAVYLIDEYSGGPAAGNVGVSLKELDKRPIKNPSGYFLFLDIEEGRYTIQANGGEFYFDIEKTVTLQELKSTVVDITFKPTPSYKFPGRATLIRGVVMDKSGNGIAGAKVKVRRTEITTYTTKKGEFAVYFKGLKKGEVKTKDGKKLLRIKGKKAGLEIKPKGYKKKTRTLEVEEGQTTSISITYR